MIAKYEQQFKAAKKWRWAGVLYYSTWIILKEWNDNYGHDMRTLSLGLIC